MGQDRVNQKEYKKQLKLQEKEAKSAKKKQKKKLSRKEWEKTYIPLTGIMGNANDYHIYNMRVIDKIIGFLLGFGLSAVVIYVFFRNIIFVLIVSIFIGSKSIRLYKYHLTDKRKNLLLMQFKDLLESLTSSYSSGKNTTDAFKDAYYDMQNIYGTDADIVIELGIISGGIDNNLTIEALLQDFANRSGLDDIQSFADVFDACNRLGANVRTVVNDTRSVINDKIEMEQEIDTMINSGKNEINIMIVMPLVVMLVLSGSGSMSVTVNTPINIAVKVVALLIFSVAYVMGRKITNIKV